MNPFNIMIRIDGAQIELNIQPQEAGTYKIIYHGALLGEILMGNDGENWEAITADELEPGGFPVYEYDETSGHQDILLDHTVVQEIGRQITHVRYV
jgi:uncharacterized protein YgfB (UPF0149 family)